jgi:hypothetical protein
MGITGILTGFYHTAGIFVCRAEKLLPPIFYRNFKKRFLVLY